MTSPSVRSTRRSTPCVLGCCGPMLTSISSVRTSNSTTVGSRVGGVAMAINFPRSLISNLQSAIYNLQSSPSSNPMVLQRELVILPQRVADPIFGEQDAVQVRMADEQNAAQVVNLALVPVRGFPERCDRGHLRELPRLAVLPARQHQLEH